MVFCLPGMISLDAKFGLVQSIILRTIGKKQEFISFKMDNQSFFFYEQDFV